jgi:hypothetical protein
VWNIEPEGRIDGFAKDLTPRHRRDTINFICGKRFIVVNYVARSDHFHLLDVQFDLFDFRCAIHRTLSDPARVIARRGAALSGLAGLSE